METNTAYFYDRQKQAVGIIQSPSALKTACVVDCIP
jgi:hypothetical protein